MHIQNDQSAVIEFMQKAGQDTPVRPTLPSPGVGKLRIDLIQEELNELAEAIQNDDLVEMADALGDLLVVVLGGGAAFGIQLQPIFDEIHRSNMTKFIDGHRREDGKWIKGPSYTPANLKPILLDQINQPL